MNRTTTSFYVALSLAVVAAVWSIKTVDHDMVPFYKNDLKYFYQERAEGGQRLFANFAYRNVSLFTVLSSSAPRRIIVIAHGVLIGCFGTHKQ